MAVASGSDGGRTLWEALSEIPDRRGRQGLQYPVRSVIGLALAAMIAGADDLMAIFRWARRLPPEALWCARSSAPTKSGLNGFAPSWTARLRKFNEHSTISSRSRLPSISRRSRIDDIDDTSRRILFAE
jgi:hypothetical protein